MKPFSDSFISEYTAYTRDREPDFNNILSVLNKQKPNRPTLFEFFLNTDLYVELSGRQTIPSDPLEYRKMVVDAFRTAGYDYVTMEASGFYLENKVSAHGQKSLNIDESPMISDMESYKAYHWNEPEDFDDSHLDQIAAYLPAGMKIISQGPGGVLENVMSIAGYEGICFLKNDNPGLLKELFDQVGSRLVRYYERAAKHKCIGAFISNDDWGFATQTMISPADMREYVFPWHKKIAEVVHKSGRPVILHSCGELKEIYEDVITDIGMDAKHSYEDKIMPVEDVYDLYKGRMAILGGIDVDFLCRFSEEEIYKRSVNMLLRSERDGGYALGSGNSIPYYVPRDKYLAMTAAAVMNNW